MEPRELWADRVKRRLERAGFKVTFDAPVLAFERKRMDRRRDRALLAGGRETPETIQRRNSPFCEAGATIRILDYGGLGKKA